MPVDLIKRPKPDYAAECRELYPNATPEAVARYADLSRQLDELEAGPVEVAACPPWCALEPGHRFLSGDPDHSAWRLHSRAMSAAEYVVIVSDEHVRRGVMSRTPARVEIFLEDGWDAEGLCADCAAQFGAELRVAAALLRRIEAGQL